MFIQSLKKFTSDLFKEHWIMSSVLLWSLYICSLSLIYVSIGITLHTALFTSGLFLIASYKLVINQIPKLPIIPEQKLALLTQSIVIITDVLLLINLASARTDIALRSPWELIHTNHFAIFFASTILILSSLWKERLSLLSLSATIFHFSVPLCTALAAFRFGYGYDPIIHQAAENYIALNGKILPLQPFYIGQYALIPALHFISNLPIWFVDRFFLPIISATTLPVVGYLGFLHSFKLPRNKSLFAALLLLIIPLTELTFTVPYNIGVLFFIWWLLLFPFFTKTKHGFAALIILSIAATLFHPLIGIPLFVGTASSLLPSKYKFITAPVIATSLLVMLATYQILHGNPFSFSSFNPQNFFSLFYFNLSANKVRPALQLLYGFMYLWPFALTLGGIYISQKYKKEFPEFAIYNKITIGLLLGIFFVSTLVTVPGVVSYEQNEFVLRLKNLLPLISLPIIIWHFIRAQIHIHYKIFIASLLICLSYFFSYPHANAVSRAGWNISRTDIEVAQSIENFSKQSNYLVLSNQILAVAGLRRLGFGHNFTTNTGETYFPYSIGPNEPTYNISQYVLYTELNGRDMRELAQKINGPVFVAIHNYWYRAKQIEVEANIAGPDQIYKFDEITVYQFN